MKDSTFFWWRTSGDHADDIPEIASKNTLARLLMDTRQLSLADRLNLSDIMKVVDEMNYRRYRNDNLKKLNFRNQDRKFFTALLDRMFRSGRCDIRTCYEKKQLWNGFLHQIHYQPKNEAARIFVDGMRTKGNESVYSEFEKLSGKTDIGKRRRYCRRRKEVQHSSGI